MTRRSVMAPAVPRHKNPIPQACLVRGVMMSSAILGLDPETGGYLEGKPAQFAAVFRYMAILLEEAGGTLDNVVKLELYRADRAGRSLFNEYWLAAFSDQASRPARHAHDRTLPEGCHVQIEFIAILENRS